MYGLGHAEEKVMLLEDLGKARVLGKETVTGMDGVGAGDFAGCEQRRNIEIAVARGRWADANALVGEPNVHGVIVGGRVHRYGGNAKLLAGAQDAQRNLSAIGDQDLFEHGVIR